MYRHYAKLINGNAVYIGRHGAKPKGSIEMDEALVGKEILFIDEPELDMLGEPVLDLDGNPLTVKKAILDVDAQAVRDSVEAAETIDNDDQSTKRQARLARLKLAFNNMDTIIKSNNEVDAQKLRRVLKELIISVNNLREE